ncbi:NAD-dependent protein deacetylase sirtuin-3, mitochondrial [Spea bombifrons]|uniref:NAD-dependent protein deacetylase sirtuin-3, mitochondrial n=1 Tax=Spea bombifrons TaxID=233779 RepID=UPI00234A4F20|nr:NAD-dependent protein deacetylase sirtuin-3, mitochondrial [Spea bombifrons]
MAMSWVSCSVSIKRGILVPGSSLYRLAAGKVRALSCAGGLSCARGKESPASSPIPSRYHFLRKSQVRNGSSAVPGGEGSNKHTGLSLKDVAFGIKEGAYRRILVMVGAGISTDSGIPDFRSPTSGLYSKLQEYSLPYPEAIFNLSYFLREPHAFLRLSRELLPGRHRPNVAHYFLRLLNDKGLLLRLYTQNIDGLERVAGIPLEKLIEAHGSFSSATCTMCLKTYPGETFRDAVLESKVPLCVSCGGLIKPDIVFFGEQLPPRFMMHLVDFPQADLLVIIGTSLEVEPFASLVYAARASIPRVLINRDPVGPFLSGPHGLNVMELGDVTAGIKRFAQMLGWEQELKELEDRAKDGALH